MGGLQLLHEATPHDEIEELFARVLSYIDVSSLGADGSDAAVAESVAVSGVSALLTVAVSRGSPQHVLQCIVTLLQMKRMRFTDAVSPVLSTIASHLSEFDITAPFHLSALQSFTITTPSPSTATSSYAARSPALAMTASPSHLFIHSACGLLKIGTGYSGSIANHHYLHSSYRQHELLSIAHIHALSTLFVSASHFSFPRLQLLDTGSLKPKDYVVLGLGGESGATVRGYGQLLSDGRWLYVVEVSEAAKAGENKEEKEKEGKEAEVKDAKEKESEPQAEASEGTLEEERRVAQKALQESVIDIERWLKQRRRDGADAASVLTEQSEELDKKQSKVEGRIAVMRDVRQRMGLTDERRAERRDDSDRSASPPPSSSAFSPPSLVTYLAEAKDLLAMARKENRQHAHQKRKKDNSAADIQSARATAGTATSDKKQYTITLCKYDPLLHLSANDSLP